MLYPNLVAHDWSYFYFPEIKTFLHCRQQQLPLSILDLFHRLSMSLTSYLFFLRYHAYQTFRFVWWMIYTPSFTTKSSQIVSVPIIRGYLRIVTQHNVLFVPNKRHSPHVTKRCHCLLMTD